MASQSAATLLAERSALLQLRASHRRSAGGTCRLLDAVDAVLAVNLPRASDWELVPAWLETSRNAPGDWNALSRAVGARRTGTLVERGRQLGLALAAAGTPAPLPPPLFKIVGDPLHGRRARSPAQRPRVVDLSGLWAGPLCAHLLWQCGAEVIKVEDPARPDGARFGNGDFYAVLNQGKRSVALDLTSPDGRRWLQRLLESADIVIESSRPRALRQLGIDAAAIVARQRLTWVGITGYGRDGDAGNRVAFGDDAGVAAGLAEVMRSATGDYQFAGDAVADPLTGIHAALAAWRSWQNGGGRFISLALADVAGACLHDAAALASWAELHADLTAWWQGARRGELPDCQPRPVTGPVRALGADTEPLLAELAAAC